VAAGFSADVKESGPAELRAVTPIAGNTPFMESGGFAHVVGEHD
jgi:hypothetical protein